MEVLTLQTRVYYPDGSFNITVTSISPRWKYQQYKHEYITRIEVLTLQTRVYYPDGSFNITNDILVTVMLKLPSG